MGKLLTCLPRLTLAQLRPKLLSTTVCTCRRDLENFPMPPWETHNCLLFAGRRCLCLFWHSGHLIVHHQWEHSWLCARSSSKVPNAPMGDSRFARCLQGGGVAVYTGGSVSIVNTQIYSNTALGTVCARVRNFPSPCFCDLHCDLLFPSPDSGG